MSNLIKGSEAKILEKATNKEIDIVITDVQEIRGLTCYFVRRKDNKQFKTKYGYCFNMWITGESIETGK